jgi:prepilin-type N-terminal cleavage/methylation domain-containing protein
MRRAFTLVELLTALAVIGLLAAILLPVLAGVRESAKVLAVNAELRQVALALEMYADENSGAYPPTRIDCSLGWEDHQLPPELVAGGYLPPPEAGSGMSAGTEDRFNRTNTYKYWAVGDLYQNNRFIEGKKSRLWVPFGFPDNPGAEGTWETDPWQSPVTWVVFSNGPRFDWWEMKQANYPVPKQTWYSPKKHCGVIVRMRLKDGRQTGSFDAD